MSTLCRQSSAYNYMLDVKDQEALLDSFTDAIGHIGWMFADSKIYEIQVMLSATINGEHVHERFGRLAWKEGDGRFTAYIDCVSQRMYEFMRSGQFTEAELTMMIYDAPTFVTCSYMQKVTQMIIDSKSGNASTKEINAILKNRYPNEYADFIANHGKV